jgi:type IV pilus biogenesis protein CpaD/CtpE
MKNMFPIQFVLLAVVVSLLTGCAASRPVGDAALGAGGAYAGYELSGGSPVGAVAGAAGGVLVSEGAQYVARKEQSKSFQTGYEKGRSDAVKQQYWLQVNQQKTPPTDPNVRLYAIPVPEQTIDGAILQPTTKYLRIEE